MSKMAGEAGFEPTITGPKPVALPLGHSPLKANKFYIISMQNSIKWIREVIDMQHKSLYILVNFFDRI
jgi:hypothetical protein